LEKHRTLIAIIPIILTLTLLATGFLLPGFVQFVSMIILLISIGLATAFIIRNHWQAYLQAACTHEKMTHNLTRDVLGFFLTMATAIFAGGMAGQWAGMQAGLWAGLAAGFAVGFLAAWVVRYMWERLVPLV